MLECTNGEITLNEIIDDVNTKVTVVEGSITKTVASESSANPETFDFASLIEALDWIESIKLSTIPILSLDDGLHYVRLATADYQYVTRIKDSVLIRSTNSNKDNCIITMNPLEIFVQYALFCPSYASYLRLENVTLDGIVGGASLDTASSGIYADHNSKVSLFNVTISNFKNKGITIYGSTFDSSNLTISDTGDGIDVYPLAKVKLGDTTFINISSECVEFGQTSGSTWAEASTVVSVGTLTTNGSTLCNKPTNRIWGSGSYFYTSQFDWTGDTASRPVLDAANQNSYFDTTLGKPIWYNGTAWVDAIGTVV